MVKIFSLICPLKSVFCPISPERILMHSNVYNFPSLFSNLSHILFSRFRSRALSLSPPTLFPTQCHSFISLFPPYITSYGHSIRTVVLSLSLTCKTLYFISQSCRDHTLLHFLFIGY